ncbi:MAG: 16S rRNA (cytidine(1402)-2'-O)-methyltransferase [Fimbriimonadaceae bacterium]|nr:16S rRNA (cytidine(1402)-2'-O)-methyltransferase [Fimbriimonadaceae bacterium]
MNEGPADLTLVAGPIGCLEDMPARGVRALEGARFVIVEDSRVSGRLLSHLGHKRPMTVLNDHSRPGFVQALVERIRDEGPAALLTDAGTPSISDPGADLVDACLSEGLTVDAIPGPSAPVLSLALSGFFAQRFAFLGFLPRKPGPAGEVLLPFADSTFTLVLFESPHRIDRTLEVCAKCLGDRRYALCRELTKVHQQVWRGRLGSLPTEQEVPRRGEFTVVIEGRRRESVGSGDGEDSVDSVVD